MNEDKETPPKRRLERIAELGPAWITAIAGLVVALTGAGFFVGHAIAPSASPAVGTTPRPTPIATVTTPTARPDGQASPNKSATSAAGLPTDGPPHEPTTVLADGRVRYDTDVIVYRKTLVGHWDEWCVVNNHRTGGVQKWDASWVFEGVSRPFVFPPGGQYKCTSPVAIGSGDTLRISIAYDNWDDSKLRYSIDLPHPS